MLQRNRMSAYKISDKTCGWLSGLGEETPGRIVWARAAGPITILTLCRIVGTGTGPDGEFERIIEWAFCLIVFILTFGLELGSTWWSRDVVVVTKVPNFDGSMGQWCRVASSVSSPPCKRAVASLDFVSFLPVERSKIWTRRLTPRWPSADVVYQDLHKILCYSCRM